MPGTYQCETPNNGRKIGPHIRYGGDSYDGF